MWSGRQKQLVWNGFRKYRFRWVLCWFVYCIYAYIHWWNVSCHACGRMFTWKVESSAGRIRNILSCIWMYKCRPRKYCCPFSRQKPIWLSWSTKLTNLLNLMVLKSNRSFTDDINYMVIYCNNRQMYAITWLYCNTDSCIQLHGYILQYRRMYSFTWWYFLQ